MSATLLVNNNNILNNEVPKYLFYHFMNSALPLHLVCIIEGPLQPKIIFRVLTASDRKFNVEFNETTHRLQN